jgi:hypothetical protein
MKTIISKFQAMQETIIRTVTPKQHASVTYFSPGLTYPTKYKLNLA